MENGCWPTASAGQVLLPQRRSNRGNCSYPVFLEPTFPLSKSCEYPPVKSAELYFRFHCNSANFYRIQFKPMVSTGDLTRKNSLGMFAGGKHRLSNRCYNSMPHAENVSDSTWLLGDFHDRTWEMKVDVKDAMRRCKKSKVVCCGLRPSCINQTGVHQSNMMLTCQGRWPFWTLETHPFILPQNALSSLLCQLWIMVLISCPLCLAQFVFLVTPGNLWNNSFGARRIIVN